MRKALMVALATAFGFAVGAESFVDRLEEGHGLLREGDIDGALAAYRDLQTEDPESDVLYYSIGCAQYAQGLNDAEAGAAEGGIAAFEQANASFEKVLTSPNAAVRTRAEYNLANTIAQIAKQSASAGNYEETITAFEEAVRAYEDFLRKYPDHEGARNNLDHMRYLLKSWLQNPPAEQPEQGEGEENEDQQQEGQDQQQQEQPSPEETQDGQEAQAEPESTEEETEPQDRQTIEAILQSLEDLDNREQYDMRRVPQNMNMRRDWW